MAFLFPLLLIGLFYFFVLPRQRRAQQQRAMGASVEPGDRVITAGGMVGTLVSREGDRSVVEVAPGVEIEFLASAIVRRLEPSADHAYDAEEAYDDSEPYDDGGWHDAGSDDKEASEESHDEVPAAPAAGTMSSPAPDADAPRTSDVTRGDEHDWAAQPPAAPRNEET